MTAPPPSARPRLPALDAMRGIAILLVLMHHLTLVSPPDGVGRYVVTVARQGWVGVDLFFALSGFLITGILWDSRGRPGALTRFWSRRARRILPLYYGALAVLVIVVPRISTAGAAMAQHVVGEQAWYWVYLANLAIAASDPGPPLTAHLWSLAVEEQVYLIWPLLVLALRWRTLVTICVGAAVAAPVIRASMLAQDAPAIAVYALTWTRLDGMALGALAALLTRHQGWSVAGLRWTRRVALLAGTPLAIFALGGGLLRYLPLVQVVGYSLLALTGAALVTLAAAPEPPAWAVWLGRRRVLRWVGTISYGLYVIHFPVRDLLAVHGWSVETLGVRAGSLLAGQLLFALAVGGLSILLAAVSWYGVERPLLEGRWPWRRETTTLQPAA